MDFCQLGLIEPILHALRQAGYTAPTPIQSGAIPPALQGRDLLGCAQTGTGKTCAFAVPILQRLARPASSPKSIRALVLTPTRELALQIYDSFLAYGKFLHLKTAVIFGGVNQKPQTDRLRSGVDILVATPGRLLDLHGQGLLELSNVQTFVLDEADRMLDMGFIHDVRRILNLLPHQKQTMLFSATMPDEVMELVNQLLHNYVTVAVDPVSSPVEVIQQSLYYVDKSNKTKLLSHLIQAKQMQSVLVFSRTKHGANRIARDLSKRNISAAAIHGNKSQHARQEALSDFKAGRVTALIATDIAARGIDIDELPWVINYDLPEVAETYVHRIGRTGRAGHGGSAISFCRADERVYLKQIEDLLGKKIPVVSVHPFPMVEPPTGVDPIMEARMKHPISNQKRKPKQILPPASNPQNPPQSQTQARTRTQKPQPQKQALEKNPPKNQKPQNAPKAPPTSEPIPKSKRGFRHGDLDATMPAAPSTPNSDFVKPNPLDSDVIMDATARLLAPRPRIYTPEPSRAKGPKNAQGVQNTQNAQTHQKRRRSPQNNKKSVSQMEEPPAAKEPPQKNPKSARAEKPVKYEKKSKSPQRGHNYKNPRNLSRPRMDRPLHASHQKDSTEQAESVMKPYYLSDD